MLKLYLYNKVIYSKNVMLGKEVLEYKCKRKV